MRRSFGFQQQCYGNGNVSGYGHDRMWAQNQDQMQHYDVHEESWQSHNSGKNMRHGGGWHEQVDSEYSEVHHATFGGKGSHGQLQQAWHGGNGGNKKWHNPVVQQQQQHGHGGNFNPHPHSNSSAHYEYEDEFNFESYSSEEHCFPGATPAKVNGMRFEHHNLGKNKNMNRNPNAGRKAEWLIKGV